MNVRTVLKGKYLNWRMRKLFYLSICIIITFLAEGQLQPVVVDSMKTKLAKATSTEEKFEITGQLARILMNVSLVESDKYGTELIELAELSRDRRLMTKAQLINGERYSYLSGKKENTDKAISYYNKGLELSRYNKLDNLTVSAYLALSEVHRYAAEAEKALAYCNQAYSYIGVINNDSLTAKVHLEYGSVYMLKNEKLLALRNLMSALRMGEELKNPNLLRAGYSRLSVFYGSIEEYDKAIDYQVKALEMLGQIHTGQVPYTRVQDFNRIGDLYASKKNYDMATHYYEKSLTLADSLKFEPLKAISHRSIINNYLSSEQPQKALDYFNQHPQLGNFLRTVGFGHFVDQSYGFIYMMIGKYDSARYYYDKIASFFQNDVNTVNQYNYLYQLGLLHKKTGELDKSVSYFQKADQVAQKISNLQLMQVTARMLDSVYQLKGDFKQAFVYSNLSYKYKDSIDKLGKEKDLMQVEAADEQQRQERISKEKEEIKRKRHSIQYMAITIGISALFIILVMMGMFKVSVNTIKAIGFFVFLMFFEFIFLLFKKNIYSVTKGEPWKDLLFMICLAAVLLPLHHWLEHKVVHYLTSHNRLTSAGHFLRNKFFRKSNSDEQ